LGLTQSRDQTPQHGDQQSVFVFLLGFISLVGGSGLAELPGR